MQIRLILIKDYIETVCSETKCPSQTKLDWNGYWMVHFLNGFREDLRLIFCKNQHNWHIFVKNRQNPLRFSKTHNIHACKLLVKMLITTIQILAYLLFQHIFSFLLT
jgi:hypothetical protein